MLLFGAIGYLAIPKLVRWGVETVASRELGRPVRVESVGANPYTLSSHAARPDGRRRTR